MIAIVAFSLAKPVFNYSIFCSINQLVSKVCFDHFENMHHSFCVWKRERKCENNIWYFSQAIWGPQGVWLGVGAGSVLDALGAGKPLLVVVNDQLMSNHQVELAQRLYQDGYLHYCTCRYSSPDKLLNTDNVVKILLYLCMLFCQ